MLTSKFLNLLIRNSRLNTAKQCIPATTVIQNCSTNHTPKATESSVDELLNYGQEESEKIVNTINNSSLEELSNFSISKAGVKKLESWKKRYGPLRNPKDLLEIEGLNVKTMQKFCSSLLKNERKANTTKAALQQLKTNSFVIPSMTSEQIQKMRSCLAVHVTVGSVSWARLELPKKEEGNIENCLLTDWQYHHITEKKPHLDDLVHKCLDLNHHMPTADCYLFENPKTAQVSSNPGNADQKNINVEKAQITAMLSYALSARRRSSFELEQQQQQQKGITQLEPAIATISDKQGVKNEHCSNVFYMRNFLHARLFRRIVGTEQISSEQTIFNLMRIDYNELLADSTEKMSTEQRNLIRGNVQFTPEQRALYSTAERYRREFLGQALLLNLAFVRLVLLQDGESIRKVSRNFNKLKANEIS